MIMISIVMPVYNKEKYVHSILKDLQKQTFPNFECIVVDDGSTDHSGIICDAVQKEDSRFQVIHIENEGVSHARNMGLKMIRGKYVTFIDADDRIGPDYLKVLYKDITESKADMVISGVEKWWENHQSTELIKIPYQGKYQMNELLPDFAMVQKSIGIYGYCCGKLFQREVIEGVKFTEGLKLAEDFEFYLQIYPRIDTVFFDTECYYKYLQEAKSSSVVFLDEEIDYLAQLNINLKYREFLRKMNSYRDKNMAVVDKILTNYVFFVVFHARRQEIKQKVEHMHQIIYQEGISCKGNGIFQKVILWCIKKKKGKLAEVVLRCYDAARYLRRN